MAWSETTLFLRRDPHAFAVLTEASSEDRKQYLAGVRYQRDTPVVSALCPILFFVEYNNDGWYIFTDLMWHLAPL